MAEHEDHKKKNVLDWPRLGSSTLRMHVKRMHALLGAIFRRGGRGAVCHPPDAVYHTLFVGASN